MPANERLERVLAVVTGALKDALVEAEVTEDELWLAIGYLTEVGKSDEFALLSDVLGISVLVDRMTHADGSGATASNVLGPFYVPGAPLLEPPYELAASDEPGEPLAVSGRVTDAATSAPLGAAELDVWQANADARYSNQDPSLDAFHLRGRIPAQPDGTYAFRTIVPPSYEVPKHGPVGRLMRELDRHAHRPAHLHLKVTCPWYAPLTTMLYFAGDPWLESDPIGSVKESLVAEIERDGEGAPARCRFDIALRPA